MKTFIISTDDYSVGKRKIDDIKNSIKTEFDEIYYDLEEDSLYNVVDELNTFSLFDNIKFIVCKSAEKLFQFKANAIKELINQLKDESSNNYLIFITTIGFKDLSEENLNNYKLIKANSNYIELFKKCATTYVDFLNCNSYL